MKEYKVEDLTLLHINVANAAIENPNNISIDENKSTKLFYSLGFDKRLNMDAERVLLALFINVEFLDENGNSTGIIAKFTIQFEYHIRGLKEYCEVPQEVGTDTPVLMNSQMSGSILSVAYSTARGILYTRCLGTIMGNVIMPIISVQTLLDISEKESSKPENTPAVQEDK
ncbi:MAG TPA: hypothetical protein VHB48_21190 [Chitinophagaceae bacterium]|nr:hypothetical protein [Chitinophagaceae bacterium]